MIALMKKKRIVGLMILCSILLLLLAGCGKYEKGQPVQSATTATYTSVDQLNGKNIGSATGTTYDEIVRRRLPDVTFSYYNTYSDMVAAMQSGKIAAFACDEPVLRTIMAENSQVTMLPEYLDTFEFGFIFPKSEKGSALCEQMSEFMLEMRESGELSRLEEKWVNGHLDDADMPDAEDLGGENGTLTLATDALNAPFDFMRGNQYAGYEVELAVRFCERYGYGLTIKNMDFDAVLASVQTDKADFGAATISITEERKQSVLFSEPHFSGGTVLAVLKAQEGAASAAGAALRTPQYQSFSDLSGKRVSMLNGAPEQVFDNPLRENTRRFVRRLKVLELNIESRDYDFLGMAGEIDQYCNKSQITPKTASRIRLAFEELVQQMLIPVLASPRIQAVIEYAEADARATMTVRYNGSQHDILENGDNLSVSLITGITSGISYDATMTGDFPNCLTLVFGEKR